MSKKDLQVVLPPSTRVLYTGPPGSADPSVIKWTAVRPYGAGEACKSQQNLYQDTSSPFPRAATLNASNEVLAAGNALARARNKAANAGASPSAS